MADSSASENKGMKFHPLFFIPAGSLADFPQQLEKPFDEEDVKELCGYEWYSKRSAACLLSVHPELVMHTYGLPLEKQLSVQPGFEPLTPYDIACVAAIRRKSGMPRFFEGRVRTEMLVQCPPSYLNTSPLTVIVSFDKDDILRFSKGYTSQVGQDLGLLVGERRIF